MNTSRIRERAEAAIVAGLLLAGGLAARAHAQRAGASTTNRESVSRIRRIEDTAEIQTLLLNYGRHLDARDFKAYAQLFAKDGVWIGGMGTVRGPAAIQAFMEKAIPGPNTSHNYHLLSNFVIDVAGDTATAWSRWQFVVPGADGKPAIAQAGRYDDTLVREDGRWRFKQRVASNDIPAAGPVRTK